jgi:hypothetical protein
MICKQCLTFCHWSLRHRPRSGKLRASPKSSPTHKDQPALGILTLIYHCNFELISIQRTRFYSLFFFFGYKLKTHLKDTTGTQPSTLLTEERGGSIRERERERERERAEAIFTPQHYDEHNDNIIVIIILQSGRVVANQFGLDWVGNCRGI